TLIDDESLIKSITIRLSDEKDFVIEKAIQVLKIIGEKSPTSVTKILTEYAKDLSDIPENEELKKNIDLILKSIVTVEKIEEIFEASGEKKEEDLEKEESEIKDKEIELKKKQLEIKKKKLELEEKEKELEEKVAAAEQQSEQLEKKILDSQIAETKAEQELYKLKIEGLEEEQKEP
ncbi:hypothetical protein LCGC14_2273550, partial [marine sediment metagenome]